MPENIRVVTSQLVPGRNPEDWCRKTVEADVSAVAIRDNFGIFLQQVYGTFLQNIGEEQSLILDTIELKADIAADGSIRLLSSGTDCSDSGIKITLRHRRTEDTADVSELHLNTPHEPLNHAGPEDKKPIEIAGKDGDRIELDIEGKIDPAGGPVQVV